MPPVGFDLTISAGERPQTSALDRAATGIGICGKSICYTSELTVIGPGLAWPDDSQMHGITSTICHTHTHTYIHIYILPPDDGLLMRPKHVEV
jgi:hypothetical protein